MNEKTRITIAIDGPAGAGKSTIAKLLARRFGLSYVDTGATYRGVGLLAGREGVDAGDEETIAGIAERAEFRFVMDPDSEDMLNRVFLNGEEVTDEIREPEASSMASKVSALSGVRRALVAMQKRMGASGGVVMEGRDIGTVVTPGAEVKIFLTASAGIRAERRRAQLLEAGSDIPLEEILADIRERDHRDTTRADSPLKPAADSVEVNTDGLGIAQVVDAISRIVFEKTGIKPVGTI